MRLIALADLAVKISMAGMRFASSATFPSPLLPYHARSHAFS